MVRVVAESDPWGLGMDCYRRNRDRNPRHLYMVAREVHTDLARETDQDVRASWRPILVSGQRQMHVWLSRDYVRYSISFNLVFTNVGRGPGINAVVAGRKGRSMGDIVWASYRVDTLAVGGMTEVTIAAQAPVIDGPDWSQPIEHTFHVIYEDVGANKHETQVVCSSTRMKQPLSSGAGAAARLDLAVRDTDLRHRPKRPRLAVFAGSTSGRPVHPEQSKARCVRTPTFAAGPEIAL